MEVGELVVVTGMAVVIANATGASVGFAVVGFTWLNASFLQWSCSNHTWDTNYNPKHSMQ